MQFSTALLCYAFLVLAFYAALITCRNKEFDVTENEKIPKHVHRRHNRKLEAGKHEDEFDIKQNSTAVDSPAQQSNEIHNPKSVEKGEERVGKKHSKHENSLPKRKGSRKDRREKQAEQERDWHYCSDGRRPKNVADLEIDDHAVGHMCRELYPTSTCCFDHDLTMELVGDKILEQVPEMQCARMLMKLRCAHCSPRSWWLFHAPDMIRYPHKRVLPIMCPGFCKRFHRLCRDSVAGLEGDNFCQYHTTNEEGPCFPDSFVKRGTID